MKFPPLHNLGMKSGLPHDEPGVQPISPNVEKNYQNLEKDLGNVDRQLVKLIQTVKKDSPLLKTLVHMEEDIKSLINELKKQTVEMTRQEIKKEPSKAPLPTSKEGKKEPMPLALNRRAGKKEPLKQAVEGLTFTLNKLEDELKELKSKQGNHALSQKEEKDLKNVQVQVAAITEQLMLIQQPLEVSSTKEAGALTGLEAKTEVSKTVVLIQKMCERVQVGSVDGATFTSIDMKNTAEVPSYFINANITITLDAAGKMSVQFSNLTREQQAAAINAIAQHPELLLGLLNRVSINNLQIGDQTITLPSTEREEESGQGGSREGGGQGGGQEGREGGEERK